MSTPCYNITPKTQEYAPKAEKCKLPLDKTCGHGRPTFYPGFHVGLSEPFVILYGLCDDCAKRATRASILTNDRWQRMKMILLEHGERLPERTAIQMKLLKTIPNPPTDPAYSYPYALAA